MNLLPFESLPSGVLFCCRDLKIVQANAAFCKMSGYSSHELSHLNLETILSAPPQKLMDPDLASIECQLYRKDGKNYRVRVHSSQIGPLGDSGIEFILYVENLEKLNQLRKQRDHLLKIATVHEVLPTILHELKNPLAAITTALEVLIEDLQDSPYQSDLYAILSEVRRMKLGFEGISMSRTTLLSDKNEAIDFACHEVLRMLKSRANDNGIELINKILPMPLLPLCSSVVRSIIFNLIVNAINACQRDCQITVVGNYDSKTSELQIQVTDNGCGMDAKTLDSCLKPFFTTRRNGSGLGLAMCHNAITEAGGIMAIDSSLGVGTTVTLKLKMMNSVKFNKGLIDVTL